MQMYNSFNELVAGQMTNGQSDMSVFNEYSTGKYYIPRRDRTPEMSMPETKKRVNELKTQVDSIAIEFRRKYNNIVQEYGGIVRGDVPNKPVFDEKVKQIADVAEEQLTPVVKELRSYGVFLEAFRPSASIGKYVFPQLIR